MRVAAYCRFSSDRQQETSIRDQLRNIENFCQRNGWPTPALYQDQAISGSRKDRPGYQTMLEAAEMRVFDVLLVDDMSRLSRDHIESAQVIRMMKFIGIRVIGVSDGTDTARDGYKLETGLRGLMSEFYLDDLAKKTHRGLMGQALEGYSAGGLPYGYTSHFDGNGYVRSINAEQAKWVQFVFQHYALGHSPRRIASMLNESSVVSPRGHAWAHTALYPDSKGVGMLGNPIYNGRQVWNKTAWVKDPVTGRRRRTMRPVSDWVIIESPDLKIIDDDLWAACEARIKICRNTTKAQRELGKNTGGRAANYLLSGVLRCSECGGSYSIVFRDTYGCSTHKNRGKTACSNGLKVKRSTIERVLLAKIKDSLVSDEAFKIFETETRLALKDMRPDHSGAQKRLKEAQNELANIMGAIKAGIVTATTKTALLAAENKMADAESEIKAAKSYEPTQMLPRAKEIYRDLVSRLENVDDVQSAREAIRQLIGEVRLVPEQGALTAEIAEDGLSKILQISLVAGTRYGRYPQDRERRIIRITGLK